MRRIRRSEQTSNESETKSKRPREGVIVSEETKRTRLRKGDVGRICVTGHDIRLPRDDVESALRKHFSSCGEITDVCVPINRDTTLSSEGFIYFVGEEAVDKALLLNGTDVGGWNVTVEPHPFPEDADWHPMVLVQGHDTCLEKTDIKKMLFNHFSSCGKIEFIKIYESIGSAVVAVDGEDAEHKVLDLDGSLMGGRKILVQLATRLGIYSVHRCFRYVGRPR